MILPIMCSKYGLTIDLRNGEADVLRLKWCGINKYFPQNGPFCAVVSRDGDTKSDIFKGNHLPEYGWKQLFSKI